MSLVLPVDNEVSPRLSDDEISMKKTLAAAISLATETLKCIEPDVEALTNDESHVLAAAISNELRI